MKFSACLEVGEIVTLEGIEIVGTNFVKSVPLGTVIFIVCLVLSITPTTAGLNSENTNELIIFSEFWAFVMTRFF